MAISTCWLIGSTYVPETFINIDGEAYVFPAGNYYLYHPTNALSLVGTLSDLLAAQGIAGQEVYVGKDRKVRIIADAGFTLIWPVALSSLFGFTTNLPGVFAVETAEEISPLLWSPGKPESPQESPLGALGRKVYDERIGTAPDGTQVADGHHVQIVNTYTWNHVAYTRFQTADELGGEYVVFFDYVLRKAGKFFLWRLIEEDSNSSDPVSWTMALGPYGYRPTRGAVTWDFQRSAGHERTGRFNQASIDCLIVPEWGAM